MTFSRRDVLASLGMMSLGMSAFPGQSLSGRPLSFTLYGMRDLPIEESLSALAKMGYAGVEIVAMPGWVTDPLTCPAHKRREIRDRLKDHGLKLVSVMESIPFTLDAKEQQSGGDKLKKATELFQDIDPVSKPLVETILGGKPGELPKYRDALVKMLENWARILETIKAQVAIKAHRSQMVTTHEDLARILGVCPAPEMVAAFDPSHEPDPGKPCGKSMARVAPRLGFIHIKDVQWKLSPQKDARFALPGDGKIDWHSFIKGITDLNYQGPICVEVSRQVWEAKSYDPLVAAKKSMDFWKGLFGMG